MNKTAIKNYAIWARVQLIESAKQRAFEYEITENGENKTGLDTVGGRLLTKTEIEQRDQLIDEIKQKGYAQVMEEAAYTWFNRFIALRFMEVNGFLPSKVRVFTDENGTFKPEILKQAMSVELDGLDRSKIIDLLEKQNNEELYKYLLITQCNALNSGLPYMFERISDWTELLFPANLLRQDSVVGQMISEIPEDDWTDAVQIIGWLYQYYNSELKDETFALLKKNVKITKERIPAATQLFTPDWIVRYMVENSLGRLWYEGHQDFDKSEWEYYLDEANQEPEVEEQLSKIKNEYSQIKPEEIKIIDPCMGSGHILVYAFDVLMQIYTSAGWPERDAAKAIVENNLYGLDIDDRAGQLAYFAVMMKARKHSRRILNGEVKPNVLSIQDSNWMTDEFIAYVSGKNANMKADLVMLRKTFHDAKEYGSILNVPKMQYDALYERIDIIRRSYTENLFQAQYRAMATEQLLPLVKQSQYMSQKYAISVTNPPYMGANGMSGKLSAFVKQEYPDSKSDLFAIFIEKCGSMLKPNGYQAMITQHAWMFLSSYEKLRCKLLSKDTINMVHLGARAFEEIGGEVVQTTSFVFRKSHISNYQGTYCRLIGPTSQQGKEEAFLAGNERYIAQKEDFLSIPGSPIAYYISPELKKAFSIGEPITKYIDTFLGIITGDNDKFLRCWTELDISKVALHFSKMDDIDNNKKYWIPYNKGGEFRKWYGIQDYVINWKNGPKDKRRGKADYSRYYLREYVAWSYTVSSTAKSIATRFYPDGFLWDVRGSGIFDKSDSLYYLASLISSKVGYVLFRVESEVLSCQVENIAQLPIIFDKSQKAIIDNIVSENIEISRNDWDAFETSWDFKQHPLI